MAENSCDVNDKGKFCCSDNENEVQKIDFKDHWNKTYLNSPEDKLGWFETDLSPTLKLLSISNISKDKKILNVGAGSTTLIDELLQLGYSNLIASDISDIALENLSKRIKSQNVEYVIDDLTKPIQLSNLEEVDMWIDRAVLHFFTESKEQDSYFNLLKSKVRKDGFVILAEFSLNGATKCSGLPVHRYSKEMLIEKMGSKFELIDSFEYTYIMPSGAERPYIYTLFKRTI